MKASAGHIVSPRIRTPWVLDVEEICSLAFVSCLTSLPSKVSFKTILYSIIYFPILKFFFKAIFNSAVRFIEERNPVPPTTPSTTQTPLVNNGLQTVNSQPISHYNGNGNSIAQQAQQQPQNQPGQMVPVLLECDASETSTRMCHSFCTIEIRAWYGLCNVTSRACACFGIPLSAVQQGKLFSKLTKLQTVRFNDFPEFNIFFVLLRYRAHRSHFPFHCTNDTTSTNSAQHAETTFTSTPRISTVSSPLPTEPFTTTATMATNSTVFPSLITALSTPSEQLQIFTSTSSPPE